MANIPIPLKVIPEPAPNTRTVMKQIKTPGKPPFPFFHGSGAVDFNCGKCSRVLLESQQDNGAVAQLVFQCPDCGAFNEGASA